VLCTAIGGQDNISKGDYGALIGGQLNIVDEGGTQAFVAGGNANVANGQNTAVVGGDTNLADAVGASVLAGTSNTSSSEYSAVVSGTSNNIHDGSENVGIIGGHANEVGGGSEEFANGNNSVIVGGDTNIILNGFNSVILGGSDNLIDDGGAGSVVTGQNHVVRQDNCFATGNNHTLDVDSGANGVAVGEFNRITDNAEAAFAEGSGACAWFSTQHAFAFSAVIGPADEFDARPYRSFAQGSYTSSYATTPGDGITVPVFSLIFPDLKYMVAIEATVVALGQAGTDVAATYKVSATIVIKGDDTTTAGRFVGTPVVTTIVADTEAAGWTVTPRLTMTDFTNDTFEIGVNSTELYAANWAVTINMCEVLGDAGF
jgi:hypothetical protein